MGDIRTRIGFLTVALLLSACTVSPTDPVTPPDDIEAVSLNMYDAVADGASTRPAVNQNGGRYVVFESAATDLVAGDNNGNVDVFRRDRLLNTTARMSLTNAGNQSSGGDSGWAALSGDGLTVAFQSAATDLVGGDTGGHTDIFIHATTTRMVSADSFGVQGNGDSTQPALSGDGLTVAFTSAATNLITGDGNGKLDVFIHDTTSGTTTRISEDTSGLDADGPSESPSLNLDGTLIAFQSAATDLITPADTNGVIADVFIHATTNGTTTLISRSIAGPHGGNGDSTLPAVSSDGKYVVFQSKATDLISGGGNTTEDIFLWERATQQLTRISASRVSGGDANGASTNPAIATTTKGYYVAFESVATDLVTGDDNGLKDVFIYANTTTTSMTRLSLDKYGVQVTDGASSNVALAAVIDQVMAVFQTDSASLIRNDTNAHTDIVAVPGP